MHLEELSDDHLDSFLELALDFAAHEPEMIQRLFGQSELDRPTIQRFIKKCANDKMDWRPKAGQTSVTHYVLIVEQRIRGYGRLRFPVEVDGEVGNLEFFVPPTLRRRGYGVHTLNRLLFEAVRAGLARALVVCTADDAAAIRCVLYNRGERIEEESGKWARFWIRFR